MNKTIEQVSEFHKTFDAPILESPGIPSQDRCELRVSLMQEELNEIIDGISNGDLVEIADGLADLLYVLNGTILEFGLQDKFDAIYDEVHRSNMSKACQNEDIAKSTAEYYTLVKETPASYIEKDGKYIVYRDIDNKVLKSIEYSKADIKKFLNE